MFYRNQVTEVLLSCRLKLPTARSHQHLDSSSHTPEAHALCYSALYLLFTQLLLLSFILRFPFRTGDCGGTEPFISDDSAGSEPAVVLDFWILH